MSHRYYRKLRKKMAKELQNPVKAKGHLGESVKDRQDYAYIMINALQKQKLKQLTPLERRVYFYLTVSESPGDESVDLYDLSDEFDIQYEQAETIIKKFIELKLLE